MALVDHVKNSGNLLEVGSGIHVVRGDLLYSRVDGTSPSHQIYLKTAIADGEWNKVLGIWYDGKRIPEGDYHFHPGKLSSGNSDTLQGVCDFFPTGLTHSGTVCVCVRLPVGYGDPDTVANPPEKLQVICEAEKYPDFDSSGNMIGFSYTTNPARCLLGNIMRHGRSLKGTVADTERYFSQYWKNRIDWAAWVIWRDYLATTELVDYTTLTGFDGFGLTASYYSGTAFDTFVSKRIDPAINFTSATSDGRPALGLTEAFSARFEGKIKFSYSETFTLYGTHDDGLKVWVNNVLLIDQWATTGTHSATFAATAGVFYDIKVEWMNISGPSSVKLEWQSTSQARKIIQPEALYPKPELRPIWESHLRFTTQTSLDTMMRAYLRVSNSGRQEVDGKLKFFSLDTQTSVFTFNDTISDGNILSLNVPERDVRDSELQNVWEAEFQDIDSQYIEKGKVTVQLTDLQEKSGRLITSDALQYPNMSRRQAFKLLTLEANAAVRNLNEFEIEATALSYKVMPDDKVLLTYGPLNFVEKSCRVREATDRSIEDGADDKFFVLKEIS